MIITNIITMNQIINRIINIATYIFLFVAIYLVFADCKEFANVNLDSYNASNKLSIYILFGVRQIYNLSFLVIAYFLQTLKEVNND